MADVPVLQTERLVLRGWRAADRAPFAAINADPDVARYLGGALTREQSDALVDRIVAKFAADGFGLWCVSRRDDPDDECIGFVGITPPGFTATFTPCVEIGWRLARSQWGAGLAPEAAAAALQHGFETVGLDEILSFTAVDNAKSRRVMEKLGMRHDPADDFDHPNLPEGHPLRRHVLYRMRGDEWRHRDEPRRRDLEP